MTITQNARQLIYSKITFYHSSANEVVKGDLSCMSHMPVIVVQGDLHRKFEGVAKLYAR